MIECLPGDYYVAVAGRGRGSGHGAEGSLVSPATQISDLASAKNAPGRLGIPQAINHVHDGGMDVGRPCPLWSYHSL